MHTYTYVQIKYIDENKLYCFIISNNKVHLFKCTNKEIKYMVIIIFLLIKKKIVLQTFMTMNTYKKVRLILFMLIDG